MAIFLRVNWMWMGFVCAPSSGLISDTAAIEEAVKSIRRNGVGLKGVLKTRLEDVDHHSLNVQLRYTYSESANSSRPTKPITMRGVGKKERKKKDRKLMSHY